MKAGKADETMPGDKGYHKLTVDQAVWRALKLNFNEETSVGFVLILIRLLMLSPMLLSRSLYGNLPGWLTAIASAAIYIFLVMPLRFWGREKIRREFYTLNQPTRSNNPYAHWMHAGLLRLLRGLLWGLPFLAGLGYFLIGKSTLPYNEMWAPLRPLAVLVGKEPDTVTGMLVGFALMLVFGLLFAYGWWRDLPFEYLPVRSLGRKHTLHWSRRMMKRSRWRVVKVTFVNILLCLPAVIGYAAVLVPYVAANIDFSLSKDLVLNLVLRLLKTPLPAGRILALAAVTLVLYLPLCGIRKMRNAALIAKLMKENAPRHHHHTEDDAPSAPDKTDEKTNEEGNHAAG